MRRLRPAPRLYLARGVGRRLLLCGLLGRHWVKFGSFPYCVRCGKHVR